MYEFKLHPTHAINFKAANAKPVGFITHLKIGGTEVKVKTKTKDPMGNNVEVVGVLSYVQWHSGEKEPIQLRGLIYSAGATELWHVKRHKLNHSQLVLKFAIYQWDGKKGEPYFPAFRHEDLLECNVPVGSDGALAMMVNVNESPTPDYHPFSFFIAPENKAMKLHYAHKRDANETLPWGQHNG